MPSQRRRLHPRDGESTSGDPEYAERVSRDPIGLDLTFFSSMMSAGASN